jgi:hypothetical protein
VSGFGEREPEFAQQGAGHVGVIFGGESGTTNASAFLRSAVTSVAAAALTGAAAVVTGRG